MDWRTRNGKIEYFVKWLDSPVSENSWIPENHIDNVEAIQEFHGKIHQTSLFSRSLNHSFIMIIMLFMVFITPILSQSIDGMFQYCPSHTKRSLYDLNELDCNHHNVRYGESNDPITIKFYRVLGYDIHIKVRLKSNVMRRRQMLLYRKT
ncbi:hypothetical protein BpHYR1_048634 [Brachionus plicatilis]|uniref:Chromo domain-containing protein n=1 Tax=Brachionus plicatilis TaxID=10195 RepID=A0A3M7QIP4_BRAPC|nr:hypothetical protein BpHYR1_048634 [Brachionus plicatilis]